MPRLQAIDPESASEKAKALLTGVQARLGVVPNLVRTMASSPAVLQAYLDFSAGLGRGVLPTKLREQIALAVAEANGCAYSLAAHSAIGKTVGLSDEAIRDSRRAESPDSKEAAVLRFASRLVDERGRVSDEDVARLRRVGYGDGEIAEIVANVALNMFTNYFNHVARTEMDYPPVESLVSEHPNYVR